MTFDVASQKRSVPLKQYIADHTGILSDDQIALYIEELSTNERVLTSVLIGADREASMALSPREQIEHAHVASGHALNFLRRNSLPDKGMQDLSQAQYELAKDQISRGKR